ncbi:RNA polymerase sigma factor [Algoriphagus limi]|uniref:Sigma-70 family RNA polymerase sigma factor n=1 Tax=Algoriphagus limi TaxID=2975273 RepID=A0ABT2G1V0_9BACT|nr:sigma-70 family RNA polymerase sigma factor [Algoriphagus limi]MCS5489241.1 sigma-70 family RNA polymerase sigma factor [Algoriphagus limi]
MKVNRKWRDDELVQMILQKKDQNLAISQLYEQHYGLLENLIIQNSGSADDAADIIQETMLVFVQMVISGKFRGESAIKSILYSIAKNQWISELRKRKSSQKRNEYFHTQDDNDSVAVVEAISQQEDYNFIMSLFERLGEKCRKILQLFYYEELPMKEICEQMEFSSEQVLRNKKYKCLKALNESVLANPSIKSNFQKALRNED